MTLSLARHRVRLQCDAIETDPVVCRLRNSAPKIWRGTDVQIEVALYWNGTLVDDLSNISSLTCEIHEGTDRDGAPLVQKTLGLGDLDTGMTAEEWLTNAEDQRHAEFDFDAADLQLDMTDATGDELVFWLVVHGVTSAGDYITWGACNLTLVEDGAQNGLSTVTSAVPTVVLYDGDLYLYNPDTALYHKAQATGAAGAVTLALEQTGVTYASIT